MHAWTVQFISIGGKTKVYFKNWVWGNFFFSPCNIYSRPLHFCTFNGQRGCELVGTCNRKVMCRVEAAWAPIFLEVPTSSCSSWTYRRKGGRGLRSKGLLGLICGFKILITENGSLPVWLYETEEEEIILLVTYYRIIYQCCGAKIIYFRLQLRLHFSLYFGTNSSSGSSFIL